MPVITVAPSTYARLQAIAKPFEDTPDSVVARLLDASGASMNGSGDATGLSQFSAKRRAQVGTLLPEREYWIPILQALEERGGSAPAPAVIDRVGKLLNDRLTDDDRDQLDSGEIRWRNRTQFARLRMKELGYIDRASPRGIWTITDEGRRYLAQNS